MHIDVWSDVICPFCYAGKRRLETVLAEIGVSAEVRWRSFELDPASPRLLRQDLPELLAAKYRVDRTQALGLLEQQQRALHEVGLRFDWRAARRGNTFDAHRLIQLGRARGCADAVQDRLMGAYFAEGAAIGDPVTLQRLAVEAGLDAEAVTAVLDGDGFAAEVRADETLASRLSVRAVPHFVVNGRSVISGAATSQEFTAALLTEAASPDADRPPATAPADGTAPTAPPAEQVGRRSPR